MSKRTHASTKNNNNNTTTWTTTATTASWAEKKTTKQQQQPNPIYASKAIKRELLQFRRSMVWEHGETVGTCRIQYVPKTAKCVVDCVADLRLELCVARVSTKHHRITRYSVKKTATEKPGNELLEESRIFMCIFSHWFGISHFVYC